MVGNVDAEVEPTFVDASLAMERVVRCGQAPFELGNYGLGPEGLALRT
jgi:hypothetical protein